MAASKSRARPATSPPLPDKASNRGRNDCKLLSRKQIPTSVWDEHSLKDTPALQVKLDVHMPSTVDVVHIHVTSIMKYHENQCSSITKHTLFDASHTHINRLRKITCSTCCNVQDASQQLGLFLLLVMPSGCFGSDLWKRQLISLPPATTYTTA